MIIHTDNELGFCWPLQGALLHLGPTQLSSYEWPCLLAPNTQNTMKSDRQISYTDDLFSPLRLFLFCYETRRDQKRNLNEVSLHFKFTHISKR